MEKVLEVDGVVSEDGKSITFHGLPSDHEHFNYHYVIEFEGDFSAKGAESKLVFNKEN